MQRIIIHSMGFMLPQWPTFTRLKRHHRQSFAGLKSGCDFFQIAGISMFHSLRKEHAIMIPPLPDVEPPVGF